MKKMIVIGPSGCGKTTFCHALCCENSHPYHKTQMVELIGEAIDTPGEYLENPRLYRALAVTTVDAATVILMQACNDARMFFPPGFAAMFGGKPVYGVIGKIDLALDTTIISHTEKKLFMAGARTLFHVSSADGTGLETVRRVIMGNDFLV